MSLLTLLGVIAAYRPWLADFQPDALEGPVDSWTYFGPSAYFLDVSIAQGDLPLWNPLLLCGTPFAANPQSKVFYPPHLLRSVLTPGPTPAATHASLQAYFLAHTALAGVGTFLLARRLGMGAVAASLASYAFVFSANFVLRVYSFHFIDVVAWLPFVLLFCDRAIAASNRREAAIWSIAVGLAMSASFLAGYPQLFIYCVTMALVFAALRVIGMRNARAISAPFINVLGLGLIAGLVAALSSMALLWPAAELFAHSARRGSAAIAAEAAVDFQSWREFIKVLFLYRGVEPFIPGLSCVTVLALAACGVMHAHRRLALTLAALVLAGLDLAVGPPLPVSSIVAWLSPFELAHTRRALVVATLPLCLLAGLGLDALAAYLRTTGRKFGGTVQFSMFAALFLVLAWFASSRFVSPRTWAIDHEHLPVAAFAMPIVAVSVVMAAQRFRSARGVQAGLLAVVAAELAFLNHGYVPELLDLRAPVDSVALNRVATGFPRGNVRGAHPMPNMNLYTLDPSETAYESASIGEVWDLLAPGDNEDYRRLLSEAAVTQRNPYGNDLLDRPFWLAQRYLRGEPPSNADPFSPALAAFVEGDTPETIPEVDTDGIRALEGSLPVSRKPIAPISVDGASFRGTLPEHHARSSLIVRYESAGTGELRSEFSDPAEDRVRYGWIRPIVLTVDTSGEVEIPVPDAAEGEFLLTAALDATDEKMRFVSVELVVDGWDETGSIEIVDWDANEAEVTVANLPGDRLLVFTDADYPGWTATVDGEREAILHANGAFKAVEVPAGSHRVRFEFRPMSVYAGAIVSIVAWTVCLGGLAAAGIGQWRRTRAAPDD